VHGLQGVFGELGRDDELLVDILDFLHHVRLKLCECLLQRRHALQGGLGRLDGDMRAQPGLLSAQWLEDGVEDLDCSQLVVEDVGPGVAPLLGGLFELRWLAMFLHVKLAMLARRNGELHVCMFGTLVRQPHPFAPPT
jgi:hypothetical protein